MKENALSQRSLTSVSACFPALNDEHTIEIIIRTAGSALQTLTSDFEIIVVDDGSTDGTGGLLERLTLEMPALRVIHHPSIEGYGAALRSAFASAQKTWIFYTDSDGQYDPAEMVRLAMEVNTGIDVICGYKTRRQDPWIRRWVGRAWQVASRIFFGIRIRDVDCDFRIFRRTLIEPTQMISRSGGFSLELILRLQRAGACFVEIPISHHPRIFGSSQFFRINILWETIAELVQIWWRLVISPIARQERQP